LDRKKAASEKARKEVVILSLEMINRKHIILLISAIVLFGCKAVETKVCLVQPSAFLPDTFSESDVIGKWETEYGSIAGKLGSKVTDTIVINEDGTFEQIYYEPTSRDYRFQVNGEGWFLDHLPDGRVRLILPGGRYFPRGENFSENNGEELGNPFSFVDPFSNDLVQMEGSLTLDVVQTRSGEYLLHHMWTSSDGGFPIFGCSSEFFQRSEMPAD
jgi:hypothetical protein